MPLMMQEENQMRSISLTGPGNFEFSAMRPEKLGATEYTLVTVVIDVTGSVQSFSDGLLETLKSIVMACKKSPRSENLLLRIISFNTKIDEIHGFKLLSDINPDDYSSFNPCGLTALFDATDTAIEATSIYAEDLVNQDFDVNGAIYIITDGEDNSSIRTMNNIRDRLATIQRAESLESLITVIVGLTHNQDTSTYLDDFVKNTGMTQYVNIGNATPQKLAKLANFVSQSISSQSQTLGTGSVSQPMASLNF